MMATFVESAINGDPLPVMGDGEQSSDFIFIEDVVDACMKAPTDAAVGRIIEIGTGINTSVLDVAKLIIKLTGSNSKIEFKPLRTGEKGKRKSTRNRTSRMRRIIWDGSPRPLLRRG